MDLDQKYILMIQSVGVRKYLFAGRKKILDESHLKELDRIATKIKKDKELTKNQKWLLLNLVEDRKCELPSYARDVRKVASARKLKNKEANVELDLKFLKLRMKGKKERRK